MRRIDYKLIEDLVPHGSTVLDLACGDGELLSQLIRDKGVRGSGVDVSQEAVEACVRKGLLSLIHISEPTRRTPISYAVFCLKKKKNKKNKNNKTKERN